MNIAALTTPAITTVSQPLAEMARLAVKLVRDVNQGTIVPRRSVLPVTLVKRESA